MGSSSMGEKKRKIATNVTKVASLHKRIKKNVYTEIKYSDSTAGHFKAKLAPGICQKWQRMAHDVK